MTRRSALQLGAGITLLGMGMAATRASAGGMLDLAAMAHARRGGIKRLIVLPAHPDDAELTMWPYMHYVASGYEVHIVQVTRGEVTAASLRLDGSQPCTFHGYTHDPAREGYAVPTVAEIGLARLAEGRSAAGAMAMIAPTNPADPGTIFHHDENLGTAYGCGGCSSSTGPVVASGIDAAEALIRRYIADYPGSLFWTHSPTDAHPDHAALGIALRNLKADPVYGPALANSRSWVSKLYWNTPAGQQGSRLGEQCGWWPNVYPNNLSDSANNFTRRAEYTAWIKARVIPCYSAWNPAGGSFAVAAEHSTPGQVNSCFGPPPPYTASALWHA